MSDSQSDNGAISFKGPRVRDDRHMDTALCRKLVSTYRTGLEDHVAEERYAELLTNEASPTESIKMSRKVVANLDVTITHIGPSFDHEVWRVTGPDLDEAARRLDLNVEELPS